MKYVGAFIIKEESLNFKAIFGCLISYLLCTSWLKNLISFLSEDFFVLVLKKHSSSQNKVKD